MEKFKMDKRLLLYIILLLPFLKPTLFEYVNVVDQIYNVLKIIAGAFVLIMYASYRKNTKNKCSKITFVILAYYLFLILSTIINKGDIVQSFASFIVVLVLCLLSEIMLNDKPDYFFKSYITILNVYVIINLLLMIIFPEGFIPNRNEDNYVYLLGIDNRFIFFFLPLLCFRFCYSYYKYQRIRMSDIIMYLICLVTLIYKWSTGAMIGMLCYSIIIFIVNKIKKLPRIFNLYTYTLFAGITNYLILIKHIQYQMKDFLISVLHKDTTLSFRTLIWDKTMECIATSPIYGYGIELESVTKMHINGANHPHNYLLTILYRGGFVGLFIFLFIVGMVANALVKCNNKMMAGIIAFTIFVSYIMCLVDSFDFAMFFIIFWLGYNIHKITNAGDVK